MTVRVTLDGPAVRALGPAFVRILLPEPCWLPDGSLATSVMVGRAGGRVRAYANVCRHHPFPLDQGGSGLMAPDGLHLLCHTHGALYRPSDGVCVEGPCEGAMLFEARLEETGDGLVVVLG